MVKVLCGVIFVNSENLGGLAWLGLGSCRGGRERERENGEEMRQRESGKGYG